MPLRRFARNYHDEHVEPLRSTRHALQWINSIERNVPGKFLEQPIGQAISTTSLSHHPRKVVLIP